MGFWRGTFKAVKATNKAFGVVSDLLDEANYNLDRRTRKLEIQIEINKVERDRSRLGEAWFFDNEFESKALINLYEHLCSEYSDSVDDKYFKQKDKLQEDYVDYKVKVLLTKIKQDNESIREAASSLAIKKIELRQNLIKKLTKLIKISSPKKHEKYIVRAKSRHEELHKEILDLEPQRQAVITSTNLSIAPKVQYDCFDDKKSGLYKDWFENGNQRWLIHFDDGEVTMAQRFNDDGSLYIQVTPEKSSEWYEIHEQNERVNLKAIKYKKGFTLFVSQYDRSFLSIFFKVDKCPSRIAIALNGVMTVNGFVSMFMPSKRPIFYYKIQQEIKSLSSVSNELEAIRKL